MLEVLNISNYALIENLELRPGKGLSILTGDTGAGKSIMLKALGLLAGERADTGMIGDSSKKTLVEATFVKPTQEVIAKVSELDPEWDGENIIIRREISPSGRSRAFLNDSPIGLGVLSNIATLLFDIHSQNATSNLSDQKFQLDLVDAFSEIRETVADYREEFSKYAALRHEIQAYRNSKKDQDLKREISEIKLRKLDELKPVEGELETLEKKYDVLSNSASLKENLSKALFSLTNEDSTGALEDIRQALSLVSGIDFSVINPEMRDFNSRLIQCVIELKDLTQTLESQVENMELDPGQLEKIENRINDYNRIIKELKVRDDRGLIELRDKLRDELSVADQENSLVEEKEKTARNLAITLKDKSAKISAMRKEGALRLEHQIVEEAKKLGLENIAFKVDFKASKIGKTGGDVVEFLASINKKQALSPISKFASGGEMARLMLAIKKITAEKLQLPTIIFDEVDTGVSGQIADRMGDMMREMGEKMQILAITHLPQVASKGKRHFKVFKTDTDDRTVSDIILLDNPGREKEIARMLSGKDINETALANARHLLKDSLI